MSGNKNENFVKAVPFCFWQRTGADKNKRNRTRFVLWGGSIRKLFKIRGGVILRTREQEIYIGLCRICKKADCAYVICAYREYRDLLFFVPGVEMEVFAICGKM